MNIRQHTYKLLLMLAAGWFCACSSDDDISGNVPDVPEEKSMAISFGGRLGEGEEETRADKGLETIADMNSFTVYGKKFMSFDDNGTQNDATDDVYSESQNVFVGYKVSHDATTGGWLYDNTAGQYQKYWDMNAKSYMFAAYAKAAGSDVAVTVNKNNTNENSIVFEFKASCASDANIAKTPYISKEWFSDGNISQGNAQFGEPVVLEFMQPFCQVRFMLVDEQGEPIGKDSPVTPFIETETIAFGHIDNAYATDYTPTQVYVQVTYSVNGSRKETYSFSYPSMRTIRALTVPYESNADAAQNAFSSETEKWYTLIPYDNNDAYHLTLTMNGKEREAVVPAQYVDWKPGYRYTYVFKIAADASTVKYAPELYTYTKWEAGYSQTTTW